MAMQRQAENESRKGCTLDDQVIGVPWITKSQWPVLQSVCTDRWLVNKKYGQWQKENTSILAAIRKAGIRAQKVVIDVDHFVRWCRQSERSVTSAALADFTNACLMGTEFSSYK
jgi:hypothetical protein